MTSYSLKIHSWDVYENGIYLGRHTGFNLVSIDGDNITIETVDFGPGAGNSFIPGISEAKISFSSSSAVPVTFINKDNETITQNVYWAEYTGDDATTSEITNNLHLYNSNELLTDTVALTAFKKIKLNAALTNLATGIEYDMLLGDGRVCNTATNYWAEQYIPGYDNKLVTDELNGIFWGADKSFSAIRKSKLCITFVELKNIFL